MMKLTKKKKLKAGIIGCGRIASLFEQTSSIHPCTHAGAYKASDRYELVACCDIDKKRLEKFKRTWQVKKGYVDYKRMLKQKLDVVSICTHGEDHYRMVCDAVRSGVKGIFCEKPMAVTNDECRAMVLLCKKMNVKLMVNHTRRFDTYFQKVKELLPSIGEVRTVFASCTTGWMNGGTHMFDLLRYLFGECHRTYTYNERDRTTDCGGMTDLVFGKTRVYLDALFRPYVNFSLNIIGNKGRIEVDGMIREKKTLVIHKFAGNAKQLERIEIEVPDSNPMLNAVTNLADAIQKHKSLLCDGYDGLKAVDIALRCAEKEKVIPRRTSFTRNGKL